MQEAGGKMQETGGKGMTVKYDENGIPYPTCGVTENGVLLTSTARTEDGNSDAVACDWAHELLVMVDVTAKSGTNPTLDVDVEVSPDEGATWFVATSFTQWNNATGKKMVALTACGSLFRVAYKLGGTSPSFTFAAWYTLKS